MVRSIYEDMSQAEVKVADFLYGMHLWWDYEQPIYVKDNKNRPSVWTPDFYLKELGIYVEVCGKEREGYTYRKEVYESNNIPIIFVHTYKRDRWKDYLINEIKRIHQERERLVKKI